MQNAEVLKKLKACIDTFKTKGLYTHAYAATGSLDEDKISLEHRTHGSDQIFDLASLSKALVTTPLIFEWITNEKQTLAKTTAQVLKNDQFGKKLSHLLSIPLEEILKHQSGLPAWHNFYVCRLDDKTSLDCLAQEPKRTEWIIETLSRIKVNSEQRGKDCYSDIGMIFLGICLEAHYKKPLYQIYEDFLGRQALVNLKTKINYSFRLSNKTSFVSSGYCHIRKRTLSGEVHDENCASMGGFSGNSGLFATGPDLAHYIQKLFSTALGKQILQENAALLKPGNPSLLGMRQANDYSSETFGGGLAMGHMGFTGTAFWICAKSRRFAIFLTNRVAMQRISPEIRECRRQVFAILNES